MKTETREFQIFAKPAGARCNFRCRYCYYLGKKDLYPGEGFPLMPAGILENFIIQNIEASSDAVIRFSWHGGEPLLAGIDFFRKVVKIQRKYLQPGRSILNGIQTNGSLITGEWCRFFAENGFVVGISIDGPSDFHDRNRIAVNGKPTSHNVMRGYELLLKHIIPAEILCVVNSGNVKNPLVLYNFFKKLGAQFITFLPVVNRYSGSETGVSPDSVNPCDFGIFLSRIFDEWVEKDIGNVKIQLFEEMVRPAFNLEHTLCIFKEKCGGVPVLEHNGDFYSCDHFVDSEHLLGNIGDRSVSELLDTKKQKAFGEAKLITLPKVCKECEVRQMCNGECPKNRFLKTSDGETGLNYLCEGYKSFFKHVVPFVNEVARVWKNTPPSKAHG